MRDMTKGAPLGHLFLYAVPLLLGNWLQLAYNAVDSIIAGRFIGQDALAAEGVAGPVMNLVILAISGLCIGAGVLMSEAFGAKRTDRLQETLATTLLFGAVLWRWAVYWRRGYCVHWPCRMRFSASQPSICASRFWAHRSRFSITRWRRG